MPETWPANALRSIAELLGEFPRPWVICGGWAIDLWLGRQTRPHKDVDIAVWRHDQRLVQRYLTDRGWSLEIAFGGDLTPWQDGEEIVLPKHVVWCRHPTHDPDFLEVLFNEIEGDRFQYRRDRAIERPLARAFLMSETGLPILAPEIVLLYKSGRPAEEGSRLDFSVAARRLDAERRDWLIRAIARADPSHPWLPQLAPPA